VVFKESGCIVLEAIKDQVAGELLEHAIYIFADGKSKLPYAGKTKNTAGKRIDRHDYNAKKLIGKYIRPVEKF